MVNGYEHLDTGYCGSLPFASSTPETILRTEGKRPLSFPPTIRLADPLGRSAWQIVNDLYVFHSPAPPSPQAIDFFRKEEMRMVRFGEARAFLSNFGVMPRRQAWSIFGLDNNGNSRVEVTIRDANMLLANPPPPFELSEETLRQKSGTPGILPMGNPVEANSRSPFLVFRILGPVVSGWWYF
ncbi:hypothetical protein M0804_006016 [Polistes exclamans]|nr:hypothetical protein M0804_006016 [Polistes exclamans]